MPVSASYAHHQKYQNLWLQFALVTNGYNTFLWYSLHNVGRRPGWLYYSWHWKHKEYKVFDPLTLHLNPRGEPKRWPEHTDGCFTKEDQWVWGRDFVCLFSILFGFPLSVLSLCSCTGISLVAKQGDYMVLELLLLQSTGSGVHGLQ